MTHTNKYSGIIFTCCKEIICFGKTQNPEKWIWKTNLVIFITSDGDSIEAVKEGACKYLRFMQARETGHNTGSVKKHLGKLFYKMLYSILLVGHPVKMKIHNSNGSSRQAERTLYMLWSSTSTCFGSNANSRHQADKVPKKTLCTPSELFYTALI